MSKNFCCNETMLGLVSTYLRRCFSRLFGKPEFPVAQSLKLSDKLGIITEKNKTKFEVGADLFNIPFLELNVQTHGEFSPNGRWFRYRVLRYRQEKLHHRSAL